MNSASSRKKARLTSPIEDEEARGLAQYFRRSGGARRERALEMLEAVEAGLLQLAARIEPYSRCTIRKERSYEEIAAILHSPMGTVKTHLFRVLEGAAA